MHAENNFKIVYLFGHEKVSRFCEDILQIYFHKILWYDIAHFKFFLDYRQMLLKMFSLHENNLRFLSSVKGEERGQGGWTKI